MDDKYNAFMYGWNIILQYNVVRLNILFGYLNLRFLVLKKTKNIQLGERN